MATAVYPRSITEARLYIKGQRFVIGKATEPQGQEHGVLFLRINYDILTDNDGWVAVQIDSSEVGELLS
ncbi:MAG: hypothetical protein F4148_17180 [Caldilineaceae bacterium SB0675_bin_29]|uniref:Uncharacterized protein n=1 Tax=Caldilineaceae bacterium SB0675_bin_29 TaxID=2605266 RepID=A0A6B1GBD9_9CHLR|nr:hypothetical protein [Caldilineaceae bacterium SB0675_bin_29]